MIEKANLVTRPATFAVVPTGTKETIVRLTSTSVRVTLVRTGPLAMTWWPSTRVTASKDTKGTTAKKTLTSVTGKELTTSPFCYKILTQRKQI